MKLIILKLMLTISHLWWCWENKRMGREWRRKEQPAMSGKSLAQNDAWSSLLLLWFGAFTWKRWYQCSRKKNNNFWSTVSWCKAEYIGNLKEALDLMLESAKKSSRPIFSGIRSQSWKMSSLLHGPISTNQILPWEKRLNRDIFRTSNLQNRTYGVSCDE